MNIKFIIMGSDENAYGVSRIIYDKYKVKPLLLCSRILFPTKYSNILDIKIIDNFDLEEVCINNLLVEGSFYKKEYKYVILIPCSDSYMEYVIKNKDLLEGIYSNKWINKRLLDSFITKDKYYKLCDKYNIKYPKTIVVDYKERSTCYKKINFSYPIVLKPNNSNSSSYLHASFPNKKKVYILNSEEELISTINDINKSDYKDKLIIQEFIKGDDSNNVVINCYSNMYGKVQMMSLARPILEEYHPKLMGNYAAIISEKGYYPLFDKVKYFLESINYKGFSNFDFKYNVEDNEYYSFEINYRQGRSSYYLYPSGINIIDLIVNDLVYKKNSSKIIYPTKQVLWLNVPKLVVKNYVSDSEVLDSVNNLIKHNKYYYTLINEEDNSLLRRICIGRAYYLKINHFKKYFVSKEK